MKTHDPLISIAKKLLPLLPTLVGDRAQTIEPELSKLLDRAAQDSNDPLVGSQIRDLIEPYPEIMQWVAQQRRQTNDRRSSTVRSGYSSLAGDLPSVPAEKYICPVCKDKSPWFRQHKDQLPEPCSNHSPPIARVLA